MAVEVVYAEQSLETEKLLDDVINRIYQFGVNRRHFLTTKA